MGLISFSELIANLTADNFTSAEFAAAQGERATWGTQAWAEGWLIGTTVGTRANPNPNPDPNPNPNPNLNPDSDPNPNQVGTRAQPFDLRAAGHTTLASTLFFLMYLVFLVSVRVRARARVS